VLPSPYGTETRGSGSVQSAIHRPLVLGREETGEPVGIPWLAAEGRHLAVLGETGMGKSSLVIALARRAAERAGVIVFDPLGETAGAFRESLPRTERIRFLSPLSPLGINALEGLQSEIADPATRERRLNDLIHALRRVRSGRYTDASYWGPRLEEMLQRAIAVAAEVPDGTLEDAHLLLASGGRGFRTLPPAAQEPANELAQRIRSRPEDAEGARRLLYEVVRSPLLVRALCRRTPELSLSELVAPSNILVLSGAAPQVGESSSRFFLSVYLALLWPTLLARTGASKFFVFLDEAQWFAHESLAEMLRLGRRRNLHVVLATQSVASLPPIVAEAVWTNVADFVAFRGSPEEAREFSRVARGIAPETLLALPRGRAAALIGKGESLRWIRTARSVAGAPSSSDSPANGPARAPDGRTPNSDEAPGPADSVSRSLLRRATSAAGGAILRIPLSELRKESDPEGSAVRSIGGRLGRARAIVRVERGPEGTAWWIDPTRTISVLRAPAADDRQSDATGPQPS
jgi:DNA helicase HerA-like ATPase